MNRNNNNNNNNNDHKNKRLETPLSSRFYLSLGYELIAEVRVFIQRMSEPDFHKLNLKVNFSEYIGLLLLTRGGTKNLRMGVLFFGLLSSTMLSNFYYLNNKCIRT